MARGGRGRAHSRRRPGPAHPVLGPADVVLVKASQVVALDRVADALLAPRDPLVVGILVAVPPSPSPSRAGQDAPWPSRTFRKRELGQLIQVDLPDAHQTKRGTPTMGGAVIILGAVAGYLVVHLLSRGRVPFTPTPAAW